jgi:hypothetical protein
MPGKYTMLGIKTARKDSLKKTKHELDRNGFGDAVNALIDEHEGNKR